MKRFTNRRIAAALGTLAILGGAAGLASAAIPDSNDAEIHACLHKPTGMIRLIDKEAGETCGPGFTEITWNQTGPAGPVGPKGDTGAKGDKGATGDSGLLSVYVKHEYSTIGPGGYGGSNAICDSGDVATGGGFMFVNGQHDVAVIDNSPYQLGTSSTPTGWNGSAWNNDTRDHAFHVYAICAKLNN